MKKIKALNIIAVILITASCNAQTKNEPSDKSNIKSNNANSIFVLELFTSQGCSSCPPADKILENISNTYSLDEVIPLSFHVDYWNRLGWKDPYSKAEFSDLQRDYNALLETNSVYTPQLIINGKKELVGSNQSTINQILHQQKSEVQKLNLSNLKDTPSSISFSILNPEVNPTSSIYLLEVSKKEVNTVPRGENNGRTLTHINVVKNYQKIPYSKTFYIPILYPKSIDVFHVILVENEKMEIQFAKALF